MYNEQRWTNDVTNVAFTFSIVKYIANMLWHYSMYTAHCTHCTQYRKTRIIIVCDVNALLCLFWLWILLRWTLRLHVCRDALMERGGGGCTKTMHTEQKRERIKAHKIWCNQYGWRNMNYPLPRLFFFHCDSRVDSFALNGLVDFERKKYMHDACA